LIAPLLAAALALQGTPPPGDTLVVRDANRRVAVPLVWTASGPMIVPERLSPVLAIRTRRTAREEYVIDVAGSVVRLRPGLRYASTDSGWWQLSAPPTLVDGRLVVPIQFVAEVIPAVVGRGIIWDAERFELRVFSKVARANIDPRGAPATRPRQAGTRASPATRRPAQARWLVVVDAGHGGPDNGMTGPIGGAFTIYEKDVTLSIARRVGARLRALGVGVLFTRTTDTLIALSDRGRLANEAGGDLFLSIHVNAANLAWKSPAAARGFETYFLAEAKTEDARRVEQMENEAVRFETAPGAHKGDPLSFIVTDMLQNEHLRESSELAELVQRRLADTHPGPDRGVKQAGFRVLVTAFMPAVLIEVGFGTNVAEARYLASEHGQEQLATAIAAATVEYLGRYERRVSGGGGRGGTGWGGRD
jgi:N-acetylmuramoyl-L-alanine amidase